MLNPPQANKLQTLVERQLSRDRHRSYSATSRIHSDNDSNISVSSLHNPSIENQMQSLLGDDTQQDTAAALQKIFDQLKTDEEHNWNSSTRNSLKKPLNSITVTTSLLEENSHGKDDMQDFSAFNLPFKERTASVVVGRNMDYYISAPTRNRKYLSPPDATILKSMKLPYPFRIKEPVSQRLGRTKPAPRDDKESTKPSKRYSLAFGQVGQLLRDKTDLLADEPIRHDKSKLLDETYNHPNLRSRKRSDQQLRDIMTWMPDQPTVWNNWMDDDNSVPNYNDTLLHPLRPNGLEPK